MQGDTNNTNTSIKKNCLRAKFLQQNSNIMTSISVRSLPVCYFVYDKLQY